MATSGTPVLFNDGRHNNGAMCRLTDDKYAIGYRTTTGTDRCRVVICDRIGTEVSVGSGYNVFDGAGWWLDMDALPSGELWPSGDADRIYVYSKDVDGVEVSTAEGIHKCGSVSGQTISWGTATEWSDSSNQNLMSVSALSSGHVGCNFRYLSGNRMRSFSADVAGDKSISVRAEVVSESTPDMTYNQCQVINPAAGHAVVTYRHLTGGIYRAKARILDYNDSGAPSAGIATTFHDPGVASIYAYGLRTCVLNTEKFVLGYSTNEGTPSGYMVVGEVSGTTITFGQRYGFASGNSVPYISQQRIGDNKFVFTFSDQGNSGKGTWMVGEVSGTAITYTQSGVFCDDEVHNDTLGSAQCAALTDDAIAISYNVFDSASGYTMIVDLGEGGAPTPTEFSGSGNLFLEARDTFGMKHPESVVFYHPLDDVTEHTLQADWDEQYFPFSGGILANGAIIDVDTEAEISYDNQAGSYPSFENATSIAVACWTKGFFSSSRDSVLYIGNSLTSTSPNDFNGFTLWGTAGKATLAVDDVQGDDATFGSVPDDEDWHFVVLYAEMSGGNWHVYGSIDGEPLTYLLDDSAMTTAMSGQRYNSVYMTDLNGFSPPLVVDEVVCWTELAGPFDDFQVSRLYELGKNHGATMDQYDQYGGTDSGSCNLFIQGYAEDTGTCDCFIAGGKNLPLYICGVELVTEFAASGDLFIDGHENTEASGDLSTRGHTDQTGQCNLFIYGHDNLRLYIQGHAVSSDSCDMFVLADNDSVASGDLFTHGIYAASDNVDLFMSSPRPSSGDADIFIRGITTAPPESGDLARPIDWLLRASDHHPQIIGTFETAANFVNIQVWDVTDGSNTAMVLASSGCYQIGDTGRWGWSTANLPTPDGHAGQYFYLMTSDASETFDGQFIMDVPEGAKWIHPSDRGDYLV
ncbi:MAG: hypothetical protein DRJ03_00595 [Chloroflexi bacterium]|nr:MAG: hypothetical protein DRJ03_00595 [Chloroflexota bacterium]